MTLTALAARIKALAGQRADDNIIVGLSGIDGAGKSTLAADLSAALSKRGLVCGVVSLDDYLQPRQVRHANPDQVAGYLNDNFDFERLERDIIAPVRTGLCVETVIRARDLDSDHLVDKAFSFRGPGIVILEGVLLFRKPALDWFDLKIWIDLPFDVAMARILRRSRDARYGDGAAIAARYNTRFFPAQRRHISRDDPAGQADIVLAAN